MFTDSMLSNRSSVKSEMTSEDCFEKTGLKNYISKLE